MAKKEKEGDKHHYIPKFYLKQWAATGDPKGRICEFSKPYKTVVPRATHPDGTGYIRGLYTFNGLSPEAKNFLEKVFLLRADGLASVALERLLMHDVDLQDPLKSAWSRFIMTLFHRTPESVQRLRQLVKDQLPSALQDAHAKYEALKREGDPRTRTFEEYRASIPDDNVQQSSLMLMRMVMDNEVVGKSLNNLVWSIIPLIGCDIRCLHRTGRLS